MKKLAVLCAIACVTTLSLTQSAQAQSQAQINNYLAEQAYYNNLYGNQNNTNYGGATVNSDGSFSNNGVSWNGADPSGGWAAGRRGVNSSWEGWNGRTGTQLVRPYGVTTTANPSWEGWNGHNDNHVVHSVAGTTANPGWGGWNGHNAVNTSRQMHSYYSNNFGAYQHKHHN